MKSRIDFSMSPESTIYQHNPEHPQGTDMRPAYMLRPYDRGVFIDLHEHVITPELLLAQNRSEETSLRLSEWEGAKARGELVATWLCADARQVVPVASSVLVRSIAAAGDPTPYQRLVEKPGTGAVVVLSHYDRTKFKPGEIPPGCGGRGAYAALVSERIQKGDLPDQLMNFVQNMDHADPVLQAMQTSVRIATYTDKPVLTGVLNHRIAGDVKSQMLFQRDGSTQRVHSAVDLALLMNGGYSVDPEEMYKDGIPSLKRDDGVWQQPEIDSAYGRFFAELNGLDAYMTDVYGNYEERLIDQNPRMAVVSTDVRPMQVTIPAMQQPGSFFSVRVPRRVESGQVVADAEGVMNSLGQLQYALMESILHAGEDRGDFRDLGKVVVLTEDIDLSNRVAATLAGMDVGQAWLRIGNNAILAGQMNDGELATISRFEQSAV